MLRAWQLALLRFAVTLDNADRSNVMAIASEIDHGSRPRDGQESFSFFRKTSTDLCSSILGQTETADANLRRYISLIEDARLKRAFASAVQIDTAPTVRKPKQPDLWRGLAPRGDARPNVP
jgi:hypothetical protein